MPGGLLDMFGIDPVANRQKRNQDAMLERQIAAEIARQKLANQGQLDVTKLTGDNNLKAIGATGNEQRKTQASAGDIAKAFEILRSANLITEKEQEQKLRIMEKDGVISKKENDKVYDQAVTDTRIRKTLQADKQVIDARNAPGFQESLNEGMQAANRAQIFDNIAKGTQRVQPGEMLLAPPSGVTAPPTDLNAFNQAQGAMNSEVINMVGGIPNPQTGEMQFQTPEVTRVQKPGRVKPNPALVQQATQMFNAPATPPAVDPVMQQVQALRNAPTITPGPPAPAIPRGYEQYADALRGGTLGTGTVDNTERMNQYRLEMIRKALLDRQQTNNSGRLMMP